MDSNSAIGRVPTPLMNILGAPSHPPAPNLRDRQRALEREQAAHYRRQAELLNQLADCLEKGAEAPW